MSEKTFAIFNLSNQQGHDSRLGNYLHDESEAIEKFNQYAKGYSNLELREMPSCRVIKSQQKPPRM